MLCERSGLTAFKLPSSKTSGCEKDDDQYAQLERKERCASSTRSQVSKG